MRKAAWIAEAEDGLPRPASVVSTVTLSTCVNCGRRWANPPRGGVSSCTCGGRVVTHEFSPTEYSELRVLGRVSHA